MQKQLLKILQYPDYIKNFGNIYIIKPNNLIPVNEVVKLSS